MKDFIPYAESLALKELGFDEKCDYYFTPEGVIRHACGFFNYPKKLYPDYVKRATFSQVFGFFREKYNLEGWVTPLVDEEGFVLKYQSRFHRAGFSVEVVGDYDSSEEAELECLRRLIAVVS